MTKSISERLAAAGLPPLPRGAWLEIDEDALRNNLAVVREMVGPAVEINAVVKADAYGHGLKPVGRLLESAGADRLCVASFDEALALREAGVRIPVLVLFSIPVEQIARAAEERIEIVASDVHATVAALDRWRSAGTDGELVYHVEVETGLARAGFGPDELPEIMARIVGTPGVRVAGLWTHLASPEDTAATTAQVESFERAADLLRAAGIPIPRRHVAATGGLFTGRAPIYQGVRMGLGLYGLLPLDLPIPAREQAFADRLLPAMALKCRPLRVVRFAAGLPVGYSGRWRTPRESVLATLPVGYADAIPRAATWGSALVRGRRVPLVGNVAMDAVMADVTDVIAEGTYPEDEFVLLGSQGGEQIGAHELARARNTIPWEVATSMAYRIPRVYHAASVLVGLRTLNSETRARPASRLSSEGVHGVTNNSEHRR